tara:strand:+ start:460 stop:648 length:189 start_codon:yes stop_codon:yes gene_type:complete
MANMSYCRFENTLRDLQDCVMALEDGELESGGSEMRAAMQMIETCEEYINLQYKLEDIINND